MSLHSTVLYRVEYYSIGHPQASMSDVMIETLAKIQYIVYCIFLPYIFLYCIYMYIYTVLCIYTWVVVQYVLYVPSYRTSYVVVQYQVNNN
jgi:hypothetical protein